MSTKPKDEYFIQPNGIFRLFYEEQGDYLIGRMEQIFPIVKPFVYPWTFTIDEM